MKILEWKNIISEKKSLYYLNIQMDKTEDWVSELKDRSIEIAEGV